MAQKGPVSTSSSKLAVLRGEKYNFIDPVIVWNIPRLPSLIPAQLCDDIPELLPLIKERTDWSCLEEHCHVNIESAMNVYYMLLVKLIKPQN